MRTALILLVLGVLTSGCAVPWTCASEVVGLRWTDATLYDALAQPRFPVGLTVVEEIPPTGLPLAAERVPWPRFALRQVAWAPGNATDVTLAADAYRTDDLVELRIATPSSQTPRAHDTLARFLDAVTSARGGASAQEAWIAAALANGSRDAARVHYHATLALPLDLDGLHARLGEEGAPNEALRPPAEMMLEWPEWRFVVQLPWRQVQFPDDDTGRTNTTSDDGPPYFRMWVQPDGSAAITRDGGGLGLKEDEARAWLDETLAAAGLPAASSPQVEQSGCT